MIQGIRQVGEIVRRDKIDKLEILKAMTEDIPKINKKDAKPLICTIDIYPSQKQINVDYRELDEEVAREYLWVGDIEKTPPKNRFTTKHLKYLLSEAVPTLVSSREASDELKSFLSKIYPNFYYEVDSKNERYRYLLIVSSLGIPCPSWDEIIDSKNEPKKRPEQLAKAFIEEMNINDEVALYTLAIDGKLLVNNPEYQNFLFQTIVDNYFQDGKEHICHLCGERHTVTWDMAKIKKINIFINQKINFASGVVKKEDGSFLKNYVLCKDCYLDLLVGEQVIVSKLKLRILNTDIYIIPELINPKAINAEDFERITRQIKYYVNGLANISKVPELIDRLGRNQKYSQVTLLFARRVNAGLKVIEVVPEVPPSRIERIIMATNEASDWANQLWGEKGDFGWFRGLEDLLYFLPIQLVKKQAQTGPALTMFRQILLGEPINSRRLVADFLQVVRAIYYGNPSLYKTRNADKKEFQKNKDNIMFSYVLSSLAFINFLRRLKIMKETTIETMGSGNDERYKEVLEQLHFDTPRSALFLFGVLLARVGSKQGEASTSGKKAVLEKINYQGMDIRRIRLFSNELFDKLRQYKLLDADTERIHGVARELLDREAENWPLSSQENVYYLLSGYAHETRRIITSKPNKNKKNKEE